MRKSQRDSMHKQSNKDSSSDFSDMDSVSSRERRDLTISDLIQRGESPGIKAANGFDVPLLRDKADNFECLETVISAIINGCIFGKLVQNCSKEPRSWLYSAISLTDCFLISLNKNEISNMVET